MKNVVLLGYGGHALVVFDVLKKTGYNIIGYYEKYSKEINPLNIKYLGNETKEANLKDYKGCIFFPAIGDNCRFHG